MSHKISFVSTGSEIVEGKILDTNSKHFSEILSDRGAELFQKLQVTDHVSEIVEGLKYLLLHSDILIVTGGLGPTSDDNTRYAISTVSDRELIFDEPTWARIEERLNHFNLKITESNRQQALFPKGAIIFPNINGTASGCYLQWENKHIFMLPGPPNESVPMFEERVLPILNELKIFHSYKVKRWLTLGLIESELSGELEKIAQGSDLELRYCWRYPYIEVTIKYTSEEYKDLIDQIDRYLRPFTVCSENDKSDELLEARLSELARPIYLRNEAGAEFKASPLLIEKLIEQNEEQNVFILNSSIDLKNLGQYTGTTTLSCQGFLNGECLYEHALTTPVGGPRIQKFVNAYFEWQLAQFIDKIRRM